MSAADKNRNGTENGEETANQDAPQDTNEEMKAAEADEAAVEPITTPPTPDEIIAELKDKLLRALAENENVRRRAERQQGEARLYAVTGFARDVLSISDNLHRALAAVPDAARENDEVEAFVSGVEMTERELLSALERHGISKFNPEGDKFDHNLHQAVFEVEDTDAPAGTVVQVVQPGYMIKERLLRPAMVGVAKARPERGEGVDETA